MAATAVITPTSNGGTGTVTVPAGSVYTLGLYVSSGQVPRNARAVVSYTTPGAPTEVLELRGDRMESRVRQVNGPAAYSITLLPGETVGVCKDET